VKDVVVVDGSADFGVPDSNMLAGNDLGKVNGVEAESNLVAGGAEDLKELKSSLNSTGLALKIGR